MDDDDEIECCKVVLVGESGVGKTSILAQFLNQEFRLYQESTSGAKFSTKSIKYEDINKELKFEIWDTAGQEKFRALTKLFYKDASVVVFVYDITRRDSFDEIKKYWFNQIKDNSVSNIVMAIAANKSDLYENEKVDEKEGREYADSINAKFIMTSAKNESSITTLFTEIGLQYFQVISGLTKKEWEERELNRERKQSYLRISQKKNHQKSQKKCCG